MDPLKRFEELFARAKNTPAITDPLGMTLSTAGADGQPTARVVLLKAVDADGLVFYTNFRSLKGRQIAENPKVSLSFWWVPLEVQVRFEGSAVKVSNAEADAYFATRPRGSQLGAWASHQSEELSSRAELDERLAQLTKKYEGKEVPRPPHWGGYRVAPVLVEFWKNQQSRLHDRDLYTRASPDAPWKMTLLNP